MVGFLWKGEREMKRQDKLSVLLMLGILCLVLVNAGAIYHMWLNGEGRLAEMKGEDPEKRSELIFHHKSWLKKALAASQDHLQRSV